MKKLIYIAFISFLVSCSAGVKQMRYYTMDRFTLTEVSTDPEYGFSPQTAVKVALREGKEGKVEANAANEHRYLNALAGPNGEPIKYNRLGSCCPVESPNSPFGSAMIDKYEISWKGQKKPVILFINMYDPGEMMAPMGMTVKS